MNTVNLPLALLTVILRRFIDKLRTPQGEVILKTATPWLMDTYLFKSCMYAYMFCAGLYYTIKHMQRGTIVTLARRCSAGAVTIKDRYVRKGNSNKNKSSLVKNLMRGREGQQRALRYLAKMTPHETILPSSLNISSSLNSDIGDACSNVQLEKPYASNPYFEPSGIGRNQNRHEPFYKQKRNISGANIDTIMEPKSPNYDPLDIIRVDSPSIDIDTISISDDSPPPKVRQKRKRRNCLTLRGRKVLKNDLSFCGEKCVRKTRSGKVYGYQTGLPRSKRKIKSQK